MLAKCAKVFTKSGTAMQEPFQVTSMAVLCLYLKETFLTPSNSMGLFYQFNINAVLFLPLIILVHISHELQL